MCARTPAEAFRYLRIPADDQRPLEGFVQLRAALDDPALREQAVRNYAAKATDPTSRNWRSSCRDRPAARWRCSPAPRPGKGKASGGLQAVSDFIDANVPVAERARAGEVLVRILNGSLFELLQVSRERASLQPLPRDDRTQSFMSQAVLALSDAFAYPAPMAFELQDFKQVQASVFQVTRSPGHLIVYAGCALLILGVFAMLYVRERRLWIWLTPAAAGGTRPPHGAFEQPQADGNRPGIRPAEDSAPALGLKQ